MVLSGVGATLRAERVRRQVSLEHVSNVTRISARYLEAIENDRPSDLPGIVFTRGFVRQYARFLDIPDETLLSQLPKVDVENAALPVAPDKPRKPFWTASVKRRSSRLGWVAAAAGVGAAAWIHFDLTPVFRQVSSAAIVAATDAYKNRQTQANAPAAAKPTEANTAQASVAPPVTAPITPEPTTPAVTAASAIQVLLTAKANAWVQVIADGKPAFTGLLHANDTREVSGNELVKVVTGNAGGLEISLNGKAIDSLGPVGQVRTVRLTAEGPLPDLKNPAPAAADADPL